MLENYILRIAGNDIHLPLAFNLAVIVDTFERFTVHEHFELTFVDNRTIAFVKCLADKWL